jgi:hypothetical protein
MQGRHLHTLLPLFAALLLGRCKDAYVSPYAAPPTGYLVVEGYISGNSPTQFTLSRTVKLPGDSFPPSETGARVQVESNNNLIWPLPEVSKGVYRDSFALNGQSQYRLRIQTAGGQTYLSDYVPFKNTPAIDSINFTASTDKVVIYTNTHDPANATRYYQWNWDQTYEYHSGANSVFEYDSKDDTVIWRPDSNQIYRCWVSTSSTSILLNSSTRLAQDVISLYPVKTIPLNDIQLGVLYTILVRQYALTESGYNFLSLMQKNSESLGSIFDAQPSQITGNIHSMTHPSEQVIGYVSAGTVQQQRLWIHPSQVPGYYYYYCAQADTLLPPNRDLKKNFDDLYTPIYEKGAGPVIIGYYSNYTDCIDCRQMGSGTTKKPSFWPN